MYRASREHEAEARGTEEGYVLISMQEEPGNLMLPGADEETVPLGLSAVLRGIKEVVCALLGYGKVDIDMAHIV